MHADSQDSVKIARFERSQVATGSPRLFNWESEFPNCTQSKGKL
jgi:hypothetical protein